MERFKQYCKDNKITLKSIAMQTDLPYSTVNDIANGRVSIENVALGKCIKIASFLGMSLDELVALFATETEILIRDKKYYLLYRGQRHYLCRYTKMNSEWVHEIADSFIRRTIERERRNELWNSHSI